MAGSWTAVVLLLVPLLLVAACAAGSGGPAGEARPAATPAPASPSGEGGTAEDSLTIELDRGDGTPVARYTLTCSGTATGDLPDAEAACAHLRGMADPFAPLPTDAMCTEQYGGPQTAHVTGSWQGRPVDLRLSRTNGCLITQWDSLGPLLPGPVGGAPPS